MLDILQYYFVSQELGEPQNKMPSFSNKIRVVLLNSGIAMKRIIDNEFHIPSCKDALYNKNLALPKNR